MVEDSEHFRKFFCSTLRKRPELQIVGEDTDGLQALQRADELQPDLILLDIGLPNLSGIDAARRIRKLSPQSKIIFLTQESSADLVREALSLGAKGYVVKAKAGSELLIAMEAVRQGTEFVSKGLLGHTFTNVEETQVADCLGHEEDLPSASRTGHFARGHVVKF